MKKNIYLIGPMAAGKSTIGKQLAQILNADWVDTDQEIVRRAGVEIAWIFDQEGEEGFRKREIELVKELSQRNNIVISTGAGTVVTEENSAILKDTGIMVYLKVSLEKQLLRTKKDRVRPMLQNTNKRQVLMDLAKERNQLYSELADIEIRTDISSIDTIIEKLLKKLDAYQ